MLRATGSVLAAASLFACGGGYSKLKADKIESVAVAIDDEQQRFCGYIPVALRALVTYRNGKQVSSRTPGERRRGRLRTSEFQWTASHGQVDALAVLTLPRDALSWYDQAIRVSARVAKRPELVGEATLRPRFDCGGTLDLRGEVGARGGEAEDGGPGAAGPQVHVALAYVDTARSGRLVLVRVRKGDEQPEHYLVDPRGQGTQFVIDARGGDGGRGGQGVVGEAGVSGVDGASGVDGVDCGDGSPGQRGTDGQPGGPGGPGANGSQGGQGGTVTVSYDASFSELPTLIEVRVDGGDAGAAGDGGAGGRGGRGGRGGNGGKGDKTAAPDCAGVDGRAGENGADGANGTPGQKGEAGTPGAPGEVQQSAADVSELFAEEITRGIPIVTSPGAGAD